MEWHQPNDYFGGKEQFDSILTLNFSYFKYEPHDGLGHLMSHFPSKSVPLTHFWEYKRGWWEDFGIKYLCTKFHPSPLYAWTYIWQWVICPHLPMSHFPSFLDLETIWAHAELGGDTTMGPSGPTNSFYKLNHS